MRNDFNKMKYREVELDSTIFDIVLEEHERLRDDGDCKPAVWMPLELVRDE